MSDPDEAVVVECEDCQRECYVTDEIDRCPYCGGEVTAGYGVVVRPH